MPAVSIFDEQHARRYDAKMDAQGTEEVRLLQDAGVLGRHSSVVDIGAGSGQFALAAAEVCERAVAVDVSPVMMSVRSEKEGITETMTADVERGWTRGELAEHMRDAHSTFTWLLEPMLERAGFDIADADYGESGMFARYLCRKR